MAQGVGAGAHVGDRTAMCVSHVRPSSAQATEERRSPMSWLSRFSLAQRALIGLMSIVAIVFGAIAIPQLKQQLLPTIELPVVSVLAPYQGASPDVVEKQVVEPIEDNLEGRRRHHRRHLHGQRGQRPDHGVLRLRQRHQAAGRRRPAGRQPGPRPAPGRRGPAGRRRFDGRHPDRRPRRHLRRGPAGARRPARPHGGPRPAGHRRRRPGHGRRRTGRPGHRHPGRQEARGGGPHLRVPRPGTPGGRRDRPGRLLRRGRQATARSRSAAASPRWSRSRT